MTILQLTYLISLPIIFFAICTNKLHKNPKPPKPLPYQTTQDYLTEKKQIDILHLVA